MSDPPPGDPPYEPPEPTFDPAAGYGAQGPWSEQHLYQAAEPSYYGMGYVAPRTDPLAIWSLVLGIAGLCCGMAGPAALGLGLGSLSRIRKSGGTLEGRGMAIAGVVLGALSTVLLVISLLINGLAIWVTT